MSQADDFGYLPRGTWPAADAFPGHYPRAAGRPRSPGPWPGGPWPPEPPPPDWHHDAGQPRHRAGHRKPPAPRYPRPADRNVRRYPPDARRHASPLDNCALLAGPPPARPAIPGSRGWRPRAADQDNWPGPVEHSDASGDWLRPAVFGAMDGLVTNSALIAGVGGGGVPHGMIVATGIAGLIAGAFSMATGEYISVRSRNELSHAEVDVERAQHASDPVAKFRRLTQIFIDKGVSPDLAEAVARQISANREQSVATHVREDLGIDPDDLPSPCTAAVASLTSFTVGALIPLLPFIAGYPDLPAALVLAGIAAFAGGAAVARLTGRPMPLGGLRQFTAAFLAAGTAFAIGSLLG